PAVIAPAASPNASPGPTPPRQCACAGAAKVVAPNVAAVAKTASVRVMSCSSLAKALGHQRKLWAMVAAGTASIGRRRVREPWRDCLTETHAREGTTRDCALLPILRER